LSTPTASEDSAGAEAGLQQYRPYLLRYAKLQLRDPDRAEDAVQETLLAALESRARFAGRSSVKTWLTGILKHKIIDQIRRQARERPLEEGAEDGDPDAGWKPDGHWQEFPKNWADPERSLEDRRFWEAFERCVAGLPARTARAFTMRELLELDTAEICKELAITETNCWVMLHRARLALRQCLEQCWFGRPT